jgi:type I restriction enzyme, R subunit
MADKEAKARIKINKLLEEAGWRFFDDKDGKATIKLESSIKLDDLGDDFENSKNGFIDFLLTDENQNPIIVLEAKKESRNPLVGKEQARAYAKSQKVKFVILSNGTLHYLWNVETGNPEQIQAFPSLESIKQYYQFNPDPKKLVTEEVKDDYVALTQLPNYKDIPEFKDLPTGALAEAGEKKKKDLIANLKLRFLRYYQVEAIKAIQQAVSDGKKRFLLEMATGTGKTLTAAAIIKLFYKTGNARRVLFLVDRLELEEQARKDFTNYLKNDLTTVVYKEKKNDWRKAEIVVTTIQSLMVNNKYKTLFSPTDFDLIISDESHRLLGGGNSRALFEYFLSYKLGLTATPKDYLKNTNFPLSSGEGRGEVDPRELEKRMLLDTYTTFGCESGQPTYRYSLADGAKDGFLIQPTVVDARTDITTKLLSEEGYGIMVTVASTEKEDVLEEVNYKQQHFERKFFSEETNRVLCKTFIENGLKDPISGEFGKGLVFAVSQNHAARLAQLLNEYAHHYFPGKYNSDFAIQVTSNVKDSQQMTIDFSNDKLNGFSNWVEGYKTSKARVCVTVGMMTTGWDCPNILNLGLMRPIFSPTEFIQIKGRGTRIHKFQHKFKNESGEQETVSVDKKTFKLFDFFATCEYFEEKYQYDQVLKLPTNLDTGDDVPAFTDPFKPKREGYEYSESDKIATLHEQQVDYKGMKVDRMFFQQFEEKVKTDDEIKQLMEAGDVEVATARAKEKYDNKPEEYFDLEKLRKSLKIDRKIGWRELLELIYFGNQIKGKDDLLNDEFDKFLSTNSIEGIDDIQALRYFFHAYVTDPHVREIIDQQDFTELYHNPTFNVEDFNRVDDKMKTKLPYYIKTYVPLNKFLSA